MTRYEERLFRILCEIFQGTCYVAPQVQLSKLLNHKVKGQNWQGALSHIDRKSVDFVLLREQDLSVICAIELDDWTHNLRSRKDRGNEVDKLFKSAPILLFLLCFPIIPKIGTLTAESQSRPIKVYL